MLETIQTLNQYLGSLETTNKAINLIVIFLGIVISSFLIRWVYSNIKEIFTIKNRSKKERKKIVEEYEKKFSEEEVKNVLGEKEYKKIKKG